MGSLRIVSADSGAAILDEKLNPVEVVSCVSVLVEPPYRFASTIAARPLFVPAGTHRLVVTELEMCRGLLATSHADLIHMDMSLGGVNLLDLTMFELQEMRISPKAKENIRSILPELRKLASEIQSKYGVNVLAVGKESVVVRIAELGVAASSLIYAAERCLRDDRTVLLGLPSRCTVTIVENGSWASSLIPHEYDTYGYMEDPDGILSKVSLDAFNNPHVRGFKVLRISRKVKDERAKEKSGE